MTVTSLAHAPTDPAADVPSFDRILVAVADSADAVALADTALSLAAAQGATVHALSVVETGVGHWDVVVERREAEAEAAVEAVAERAADAAVEAVRHVRYGAPDDTIAAYAADHGADLVVMGAGERTGLRRLVSAGAVTPRVQRRTSVPVLAVPVTDGE